MLPFAGEGAASWRELWVQKKGGKLACEDEGGGERRERRDKNEKTHRRQILTPPRKTRTTGREPQESDENDEIRMKKDAPPALPFEGEGGGESCGCEGRWLIISNRW